jgi:hypothetical protein
VGGDYSRVGATLENRCKIITVFFTFWAPTSRILFKDSIVAKTARMILATRQQKLVIILTTISKTEGKIQANTFSMKMETHS